MKKITLTALALVLFLAITAVNVTPALASVELAAKITPSNGDPNRVVQVWGTDGYNTPKIAAGEGDCPVWYYNGCFDLTETSYYQNQMIELARQVVNAGMRYQFPHLSYWYQFVN